MMPIWTVGSERPKESSVRWSPDPPWEGATLGERVAHCKVQGLSAISYAQMAKLMDLPFGLWIRVGWRKHEFNRIRQVAAMYPITLCYELYKNDWTYQFAVWAVDSDGLKEAQVQSYSPSGTNVSTWEGTLVPPGEYNWIVCLQQITLTTCDIISVLAVQYKCYCIFYKKSLQPSMKKQNP